MVVTPSGKPSYPALMPDGIHQMTIAELRALCVGAFPSSKSRPIAMNGLEQVIAVLETEHIEGELWINGSFLTRKVEVGDIDLSLRVSGAFSASASPDQRQVLQWLNANLKTSHHCDTYVFEVFPPGHVLYGITKRVEDKWRQWWGKDRNGNLKGIAEIRLSGHG